MGKPKPKKQSRTIRFNNLASILVSVLAALPSIVSYVFELLGDPQVSAVIADAVPVQYRAAFAVVVLIIAQRNKSLRMSTTSPIAERWLSTEGPSSPPDVPSDSKARSSRRGPRKD